MSVLNQSQIEVLHLHGCLQMQYQHPEKAVVLLKALVLCAPEFKPAQYTLALACLEAEEYESAVKLCRTLLVESKDSDKPALFLCLSRAYWRLDKTIEAREAYGFYIDMNVNSQPEQLSGTQ
ncbi:hypothetical protein Sps_05566 [Shewanella psychrophila]|uniref:Uncharacterized protein n=1 Tax=Shewanella psychrophila TaxID=225848 RepID=A0A1S6HYP9_9GAMM|nr:translocation protein Y [Shewanella psychrophila]AQS40629.1 hypothetical protein Sps_05566 [Shewanella psychrophila]